MELITMHSTNSVSSSLYVKCEYVRTPFIWIKWDHEQSGYTEIPDYWIFLWKQATLAVWLEKNVSTKSCCRPHIYLRTNKTLIHNSLYRVSQEEWTKLRESVPYVELYRYNPKHLYPKLNGYGDNGLRKVWTSCISAYCTSTVVSRIDLDSAIE